VASSSQAWPQLGGAAGQALLGFPTLWV
jgi:hypothetical protein